MSDGVATKADVQAMRADMKADIGRAETALKADVQAVRADMLTVEARQNARIDFVEHRLLTRLGGLAVLLTGIVITVLHYWPAGHG